MKIAEAQRNLTLHDFGDKRAEAIGTQLRTAGLLPKGGRGPYAPDASEAQVALYTIAVGGTGKVSDAVETATRLAHTADSEGNTLLRVLTFAIANWQQAEAIRGVYLFPKMPMARIEYRDGTVGRFFTAETWALSAFVPEAQGQGYVGPIGFIGGAVIGQMAIGFQEDTEAGEFVAE